MKYTLLLLAALCSSSLAPVAQASELVVSRADTVEPDAELKAAVAELRQLAAGGRKSNLRKVEALFAPRVKVFARSLDPFQPWNPVDDLTGKYLAGTADVMVEQGELAAGLPVPDYRLEAMKMLVTLVPEKGASFGTLREVPGAVCAPAVYKVDRKKALAFARRFQLDAYSLRFHPVNVVLSPAPKRTGGHVVPAYALMMFDYDPKAPEGWGFYETAGGAKGYMRDRDDTLGLSQNHVCFGKVDGKYRITAVLGYGL